MNGTWRYQDATVRPIEFKGPGPDLKPSGAPVQTLDIEPKAGAADFDDRHWPVVAPGTLDARRANGRLSFNWYRIRLTMPERIGMFGTSGSTADSKSWWTTTPRSGLTASCHVPSVSQAVPWSTVTTVPIAS